MFLGWHVRYQRSGRQDSIPAANTSTARFRRRRIAFFHGWLTEGIGHHRHRVFGDVHQSFVVLLERGFSTFGMRYAKA
jgi:hypothetical protein